MKILSEDRNYHRRRNRSSRVTFPFHPRQDCLYFQPSFDSCLDSKGLRGWRGDVIQLRTDVIPKFTKKATLFSRDTKPMIYHLHFYLMIPNSTTTIIITTIHHHHHHHYLLF